MFSACKAYCQAYRAYQYKLKRCRYVKFKWTMTKFHVQKPTDRTKHKTQQTFRKKYFCFSQP